MKLMRIKYDCPNFISKGGHCKIQSHINPSTGAIIKLGCSYPKDIDRCPYLKDYLEKHKWG